MNSSQLDAIFDLLRKDSGVEPLSREFIFDRRHAQARNAHVLGCFKPHRTILSLLLHEGMDNDRRAQIFPGRFDLGSQRPVLDKECTYAALSKELFQYTYNIPDVNEPFEPVKIGIKRLTGRPVSDFLKKDKATTLRTVKLLYLFSKNRSRSIFSILSKPENGKAGLEFRDAYPNEKTKNLIWLISDLREYLSAELSTARIDEICEVFSLLQTDVEREALVIEKVLVTAYSLKYTHLISAYDDLINSIEQFRFDIPNETLRRLDETLYIYLCSLEFRHFAQQTLKINAVGTTTSPVVSITKRLHAFAQNLPPFLEVNGSILNTAPKLPNDWKFRTKDIPVFSTKYSHELCSLMDAAISTTVNVDAIRLYAPYAESLLSRVLIFEAKESLILGNSYASLPEIVAAFCAVHDEHLRRTNFKPYWHGQSAIGDSLLASLKSRICDESVYEEHTQIWRIRLFWFRDAINGHSEWCERKLKLNSLLLTRLSELARLSDTRAIVEQSKSVFDHISEMCRMLAN